MKVFLTSAYTHVVNNPYSSAYWLQSNSNSSTCSCVENPEDADLIIFVERHPPTDPYFRRVLAHSIYKKYKRKCVLYHDADLSITPLPTISPSIELWQYNSKHKTSIHYISTFHEAIDKAEVIHATSRKYLYSFMGSKTHSVRNNLIKMKHPSETLIKDTTGLNSWELSSEKRKLYENEYVDSMNSSFFVLCPRGIGPCTHRLFETLKTGRVPVIISDQWVSIAGINWSEISLRIKEADIKRIPAMLNERKEDAIEMGKKARRLWEIYFSPEVSLESIATSAMKIIEQEYSFTDFLKEHLQFLQSQNHLKNYLRYSKNRLLRNIRRLSGSYC